MTVSPHSPTSVETDSGAVIVAHLKQSCPDPCDGAIGQGRRDDERKGRVKCGTGTPGRLDHHDEAIRQRWRVSSSRRRRKDRDLDLVGFDDRIHQADAAHRLTVRRTPRPRTRWWRRLRRDLLVAPEPGGDHHIGGLRRTQGPPGQNTDVTASPRHRWCNEGRYSCGSPHDPDRHVPAAVANTTSITKNHHSRRHQQPADRQEHQSEPQQ